MPKSGKNLLATDAYMDSVPYKKYSTVRCAIQKVFNGVQVVDNVWKREACPWGTSCREHRGLKYSWGFFEKIFNNNANN